MALMYCVLAQLMTSRLPINDKCVFVAAHHTAVGTVKLKDLAVETGRRIEYQATQLVAKYSMGHGGLRPEATAIGCISANG